MPGVTSAVRLQEALLCSPAAYPNPPRSPGLPHLRPGIPEASQPPFGPLSSPVPSGQPWLKTPRVLLVAFRAATDTPLSRSSRTPPTSQQGRPHAPLLRCDRTSCCSGNRALARPPGRPVSAPFCSTLLHAALQTP